MYAQLDVLLDEKYLRLPLVFSYFKATVVYEAVNTPYGRRYYVPTNDFMKIWTPPGDPSFVDSIDFVMYEPTQSSLKWNHTTPDISDPVATQAATINQAWVNLDQFLAHTCQPSVTAGTVIPTLRPDIVASIDNNTSSYNELTGRIYDAITNNNEIPLGVATPMYVSPIESKSVTSTEWEDMLKNVQSHYDECGAKLTHVSKNICELKKQIDAKLGIHSTTKAPILQDPSSREQHLADKIRNRSLLLLYTYNVHTVLDQLKSQQFAPASKP